MKEKYYTKNILNEMVLDSIKNSVQAGLGNVKVTNVGSDLGLNSSDLAGQVIG
jgi:hypothetical protein